MAELGVQRFRAELEAEQYHAMYAEADDDLRRGINEADFMAAMRTVRVQLGKVHRSRLKSYEFAKFIRAGTTITLTYSTECASGIVNEEIGWRISGTRALLHSYNMSSP